jgi:hypothetical protein
MARGFAMFEEAAGRMYPLGIHHAWIKQCQRRYLALYQSYEERIDNSTYASRIGLLGAYRPLLDAVQSTLISPARALELILRWGLIGHTRPIAMMFPRTGTCEQLYSDLSNLTRQEAGNILRSYDGDKTPFCVVIPDDAFWSNEWQLVWYDGEEHEAAFFINPWSVAGRHACVASCSSTSFRTVLAVASLLTSKYQNSLIYVTSRSLA